MLPDESGSVQVSSAMPARQRNATFHQHIQSQGGTVFDGQHVRLGSARDAGAAGALAGFARGPASCSHPPHPCRRLHQGAGWQACRRHACANACGCGVRTCRLAPVARELGACAPFYPHRPSLPRLHRRGWLWGRAARRGGGEHRAGDGRALSAAPPLASGPVRSASLPPPILWLIRVLPHECCGEWRQASLWPAASAAAAGRSFLVLPTTGTLLTWNELANTPFERLRMLEQVKIEGDVNIESRHVEVLASMACIRGRAAAPARVPLLVLSSTPQSKHWSCLVWQPGSLGRGAARRPPSSPCTRACPANTRSPLTATCRARSKSKDKTGTSASPSRGPSAPPTTPSPCQTRREQCSRRPTCPTRW